MTLRESSRDQRSRTDPVGPLTVAPTQPRPGLVLVRVLGEIDMLTAHRLRDVLEGASTTVAADRDAARCSTEDGDEASVVCDLEGVTFLGASGLDVLATAHAAATARRVRLVLVASHRTVVRPLKLTALDGRLGLTASHPATGRGWRGAPR